ncbi:MAG: phosphatase PAP2 family protein [Clostridiaceae bacterium]
MESVKSIFFTQWKELMKRAMLGLSVGIVSSFYPIINQHRESVKVLNSFVDVGINFNQYFIIPYISWYVYVFGFIVMLGLFDGEEYYKLILALVVTMLLSFIFFIFFPTTVPRPEVLSSDPFSRLVLIIYSADKPYNCLPSAHVSYSMIIATYVAKSKCFSNKVKFISSITCIMIVLSTLYVKQHYFLDAVTGVLITYFVVAIIEMLWWKKEKSFE